MHGMRRFTGLRLRVSSPRLVTISMDVASSPPAKGISDNCSVALRAPGGPHPKPLHLVLRALEVVAEDVRVLEPGRQSMTIATFFPS